MKKNFRVLYLGLMVIVLLISVSSTTYAYLTASTSSASGSVKTKSTIYKISMNILPVYSDFSFIPMNDTDAIKALKNKCIDKYNRGACSAYKIFVYDYDESLSSISGVMDITTNNMKNLSYMVLEESSENNLDTCVQIGEKNYCVAKEASPILEGNSLSLGDSYDVYGKKSKELILLLWLTNLDESQNEADIGSFQASVTIFAGNGGEVKGTIASSVKLDSMETKEG